MRCSIGVIPLLIGSAAAQNVGDVRLMIPQEEVVGTNEGRLEVFVEAYTGATAAWHTMCRRNFGAAETNITCGQLGYSIGFPTNAGGGSPTSSIWKKEFNCRGTEATLVECDKKGWSSAYCSNHYQDVGVMCGNNMCPKHSVFDSTLEGFTADKKCGTGMVGKQYKDCLIGGQWKATDQTKCHAGGETYLVDDNGRDDPSLMAGSVRIVYNGGNGLGSVWICSTSFDDIEARLICDERGYQYSHWSTGPTVYSASVKVTSCYGKTRLGDCNMTYLKNEQFRRCDDRSVYVYCGDNLCPADGPFPSTVEGVTSTVSCPVGYLGNQSRMCAVGGQWEAVDQSDCVPACKETSGDWVEAGSTEWVSCASPGGMQWRVCGWDGQWQGWHQDHCVSDTEGAIRLVGGSFSPRYSHSGRLEVRHNNEWGTVCSLFFEEYDAAVGCRQLGYSGGDEFTANYGGDVPSTIWMSGVDCGGTETALTDCGFAGWGVVGSGCGSSKLAGIRCPFKQCATDGEWTSVATGEASNLPCADAAAVGQAMRVCHSDGAWSQVYQEGCTTATMPQCPANNGWPETRSTVTLQQPCTSGTGNVTRTCNNNGSWQAQDTSACMVVVTECSQDGAWPATPVGDTAVLNDCPPNSSGDRRRVCGTGGVWGAVMDTCQVNVQRCPQDGVWPSTSTDSTAEVACSGTGGRNMFRYCSANGEWLEVNTSECPSGLPDCPQDGVWPRTPADATVQANCPSGSESMTRYCTSGGVWQSPVTTQCATQPIVCPAQDGFLATQEGQVAVIACPTKPYGQHRRLCTADGWGPIVDTCSDDTLLPTVAPTAAPTGAPSKLTDSAGFSPVYSLLALVVPLAIALL